MKTGITILILSVTFLLLSSCSSNHMGNFYAFSGESNTRIGVRYLLGRGVPQSNTQAFHYFSKAAKEDDAFAQNELAYLYAAGKGTPKDYSMAFTWYTKASKH